MLTRQQFDELDAHGLLGLPQAVPVEEARRMASRVREHLGTDESIRRNTEQDFLAESPAGLQPLARSGVFDSVADGAVPLALDELYGADRWQRPRHWGRPLVTFNVSGSPWHVPSRGWHLDVGAEPRGDPPGVTVFVILAPLRPGGGGTLILTGTHRLLRTYTNATGDPLDTNDKTRRRKLGSRHPWLQDLWGPAADTAAAGRSRRYLREGAVLDDVPVRVVELTGEPGDAFLMRADTFHTPAPNGRTEPRMMLAKTFALSGLGWR